MTSTPLSRPGRWTLLLLLPLILLALGAGWLLGHRQGGTAASADDPKQLVLDREADGLRRRLARDEASDRDRQRLLELLVALDRRAEAIALLEPMADREPDRWTLRLMLAELRRDGNDRSGAARELRQILSRQPLQVEALQLLALIDLELGQGARAETLVRDAYLRASRPEPRPEALGIGLLLGELQQRRQQPAAAAATYGELARRFPADQRPLLALALLRHDRGDAKGAQEALAEARLRGHGADRPDALLDRVAASWGLQPLRAPSPSAKGRTSPPESPPPAHRNP